MELFIFKYFCYVNKICSIYCDMDGSILYILEYYH